MPYLSRKVRGKNCYRVFNRKNKRVFSKCATRKNATKQMRLLRALEFNKKFIPYSKTRKNRI
jgi:hypothetical protein